MHSKHLHRYSYDSSLLSSFSLLILMLAAVYGVFTLLPYPNQQLGEIKPQSLTLGKPRFETSPSIRSKAAAQLEHSSLDPNNPAHTAEPTTSGQAKIEAPTQASDDPEANFQLALARSSLNEDNDAEAARLVLEELLEKHPDNLDAAAELYFTYEKLEDLEGGILSLKELEAKLGEGEKPGLDYILGRLQMEAGEAPEGLKRLERVVSAGTDDPYIREQLAIAYIRNGDSDNARQIWESLAQEQVPSQASFNAKTKLAEIMLSEGRREEAKATLEELLKLDPEHPHAKQLLTRIAHAGN